MSEDAQLILLNYLTERYGSLKRGLTHMLGNADLASDALHDAWLRLNAKKDYGAVRNPGAYLMRMSINIAMNIHRGQKKIMSGDDIDIMLEETIDPAPGPEKLAEVRSDLAALEKCMDRMPERRQKIVFLVHWEGLEQREVATRLGISERTVAYELKHAHETVWSEFSGRKK